MRGFGATPPLERGNLNFDHGRVNTQRKVFRETGLNLMVRSHENLASYREIDELESWRIKAGDISLRLQRKYHATHK